MNSIKIPIRYLPKNLSKNDKNKQFKMIIKSIIRSDFLFVFSRKSRIISVLL
jgi:hypothetical protein